MDMIGERAKDKLTYIAAAMSLESMPPAVLPEVQGYLAHKKT